MAGSDLSIGLREGRLNLRVGAVILLDGRILMVRNDGEPHYYTVGGRARFGETAREAVAREAFEETGIRMEVERLAFVHENFFTAADGGEDFHEICMFFLMKPTDALREMERSGYREEYGEVALRWLPVDALEGVALYPEFFRTELADLSDGVRCFVTRDDVTSRTQ